MSGKSFFGFLLIIGLIALNPGLVLGQSNPFDESNQVTNPQAVESPFSVESTTNVAEFEIDGSWVNIRTGPGTNNSVIKTLPRGTKGKKLEERDGWSKIDFGDGLVGWVYNKLLAKVESAQAPQIQTADNTWLDNQFERWDRHLGEDLLDYSKFPWWWRLSRAERAFKKGNYKSAYELARKASGNTLESAYMQAKCLAKMGKTEKAEKIMQILEKYFEDIVVTKKLENISKPYIDEPIVFKFGGFDDIDTYKNKKQDGNRLGLNSDEYYEKFVNIKTWKWRSKDAYNEFQKIGGIDCSGFVQRIQKEAFEKAGVKYPITTGRTSTRGLWSQKYTDEVNPGVKPPPPPDIRPGDMILLDYGHNRYGHSMIYKGRDGQGNIIVIQMGDTAQEAILPAHKYQYYKGTYRMKGMDQVRKSLTA
jgi:hypothetical protein